LGNFFVANLDYIYMVFGMCLFSISAVSLLLINQNTYPQLWKRLTVFGVLLGTYILFELFTLEPGQIGSYARAKLILSAIAFISLFDYGRSEAAKRIKNKKLLGLWIYLIPLPLIALHVVFSSHNAVHDTTYVDEINALVRYFLGAFGGLWASYIIFTDPEYKAQRISVRWPYICLALFISLFSLTHLFPAKADFFPANTVNMESFLQVTGFHIQLPRAVIMLFLLITLFFGFKLTNLQISKKIQIAVTFLVILIVGFFSMTRMGEFARTHLSEALSEKVKTAAASINYRRIMTLEGSLKDIGTADFTRIKEVVVQIRNANHDCRFAYLIGKRDNKIFFYLDSEPPSSKDYSAPGSLWEKYPPGLLTTLYKGADTVDGPYTDEWGTWISGFSPIKDLKTGNIVAVFGFDINAVIWQNYISKERTQGALIVLAVFFVLLLLLLLAGAKRISEKELEETQEKFERAFSASQLMNTITVMDTGEVVDVNKAFLDTFGYTRQEVIGRSTKDLSVYQNAETRARIVKELEENGKVTSKELRGRAKNGEEIIGLMSASVMTVKGIRHVVSSINNVTAIKKMEEELRAKNLMLSTQQEVSIDGILSVDEAGSIIAFNQRFIDMWGVPADAMVTGADEPVLRSVVEKVIDPDKFLEKVKYLYNSKHEKSRDEILLVDGRTFDRYSSPMFRKKAGHGPPAKRRKVQKHRGQREHRDMSC
jgi:PAS domain S-box-containing protein